VIGFYREDVMHDKWWDDPTEALPPPGALSVEPRGEGQWEFVYPRLTMTIYDFFEDALESWRVGDEEYAEQRYRRLLADYPEFIDVYHHLAMLMDVTDRKDEARALWQHAVEIGLQVLPEQVRAGSGELPWLFLDNRPFLRAYHGLGLEMLERGQVEGALKAFLKLLAWNPNDNQGIRSLTVDCYFRLGQPDGVLEICDRFPEDGMEGILYGRPLALFQLGEIKRARKALALAVYNLPLVAQELVKKRHRKPKDLRLDRVALWSPEQAYLYWKEQGSYWKETPGALDLLREVLDNMPGQEP
jgi:tetratricopeptide (TPR) repeat protein